MMLRVSQSVLSHTSRVNGPMNINYRRETLLGEDRWVYIWADGIYSGLRAKIEKLYAFVINVVNELGQKQFLTIEDDIQEYTQSWREALLKIKSREMNVPHTPAIDWLVCIGKRPYQKNLLAD